jgi:GDP-4-dehydro-6-deoxy-D-mannose reductase
MTKRALITGIGGFVGSHLAEYCLSKDIEVWGVSRRPIPKKLSFADDPHVHHIDADLMDAHSLFAAVREVMPDYVFHLAAQSFVPTSWVSPTVTLETNIVGTANLFEAVRKAGGTPVIQIAGSSEEYGLVKENEVPITENSPLRPQSPYGVSKVAMDYLGYQYSCSYHMNIIRTRAFNHTGPRRTETFAESNFARQIARIEAGLEEPIVRVGNLDAIRDYTDVRDIVAAYVLAMEHCVAGEAYNICSGNGIRIGDMLETLLSLSTKKIQVEHDPARMRPSEVPRLIGDGSKFRLATGWEPKIPFDTTLADLLGYWRKEVKTSESA